MEGPGYVSVTLHMSPGNAVSIILAQPSSETIGNFLDLLTDVYSINEDLTKEIIKKSYIKIGKASDSKVSKSSTQHVMANGMVCLKKQNPLPGYSEKNVSKAETENGRRCEVDTATKNIVEESETPFVKVKRDTFDQENECISRKLVKSETVKLPFHFYC